MRVNPHKYGESILLAISGGVDSLVMGELFIEGNAYFGAESPSPVSLAVAHCNFHLRGRESDGDAAFVKAWAERHGLKCYTADFQTEEYAREQGVSIEMAARELRYEWFDRLCREYGFDGVCVAHNANDNAETLMLNLLRGSGVKGLCAMAETSVNPYGSSRVFRPMLGFTRDEIEAYATGHGLSWRTDSTNALSDYKRNRIRNEIFPLFAKINPSYIDTFSSDISNFCQAEAIIRDYCSRYDFDADGNLALAALKADKHWHYVLYDVLSRYGFSPDVIADVASLLDSGDRVLSGKRFLSAKYILVTTSKSLVLSPRPNSLRLAGCGDNPSHAARGPLPLRPGGYHGPRQPLGETQTGVEEPIVEELEWDGKMSPKTERGVLLVDADALGHKPAFRLWDDGDWLNPIGLKGKKKVSDMLTDLKYNILEKENVLVLEGDGHHVLAVVGERIDTSLKITPATRRVYRISIV
ncbi:MAG: tRNA lysidine(34) synthetase TilS [Bacteroidales bacterium]|nr:tRNA lysidine(34) synthetase TilS [Bacteroidales bacterium]